MMFDRYGSDNIVAMILCVILCIITNLGRVGATHKCDNIVTMI